MGKRPMRKTISAKNLIYRGVPREFIHSHLDEYELDEDIHEFFARYMDNMDVMVDDRINVILYGSNGSGKTYLTSLVVKDAYIKRYTSFRITLQAFINLHFKQNEEGNKEKLNNIINCEVLVIDEVGKETFGEKQFNITVLEELLRERDAKGNPTFICTNLPLESKGGLYSQYGNSIRDLINGNFVQLEFNGESNRKEVTKKKTGLSILLGED